MAESGPVLLDAYLLPDGRPKPSRWRGTPSSLASVIHKSPHESLGELLDRLAVRRRAWQRRKRLYRAFDHGLATHPGGHLRWGRVGKPGATVAEVRRHFGHFSERLSRRWKFDYLAVIGVSRRGIVHVHFSWFGDYVPVGWVALTWGEIADVGVTPGINCWVEDVADQIGARRYLGRQLVGYLGQQEGQGRWSASSAWRGGSRSVAPPRSVVSLNAEMGITALEFVRGVWYSPRRERVRAAIYADDSGRLHSTGTIGEILEAARHE